MGREWEAFQWCKTSHKRILSSATIRGAKSTGTLLRALRMSQSIRDDGNGGDRPGCLVNSHHFTRKYQRVQSKS